ncbi:MAG: DUF368 domain-containing protein [Thermodesulfobacteriota bacterium]
MKPSAITWKQAFEASPGPSTVKEAFLIAFKGLCMGTADIIPGVSGGTIALITGIYSQLLKAIQSFGLGMLNKLMKLDIKGALAEIHIRFLVSLLTGISLAIISLARLMNHLLNHHPVPTWSLFFGLIAASILVVGKKVNGWDIGSAFCFLSGTIAAYFIVSMIPVSTPEAFWFIFLSGMIAICAMILPGISGAFILLILGKYEFITGALKNPFLLNNFLIIIVFCTGCGIGLLGFSRVLNYFLDNHYKVTLAFLTGLMTGSMQKIWPWKETVQSVIIRGKEHVLVTRNVLPGELNGEFYLAVGLAVIGFIIVLALERLSEKES